MKFVCDSCATKYSIADERVRGRVLKIRCKTCDHVITVREEAKADEPPASLAEAFGRTLGSDDNEHTVVSMPPPSAAAPAARDDGDWYVSFDGEQEGPMPLGRALDRVRKERPNGRECHCWRPGFFVWLGVEEVPEFAPALERSRKASMPPPMPATPAARRGTGSQPVVKSPTGSQPVVKSPTGSQPVVKSPTGSQPIHKPEPLAAGGLSPVLNEPAPLPPLDSKPVPLPPPPEPLQDAPLNLPLPSIPTPLPKIESVPSGPMMGQVTKPEPRIARRAQEDAGKNHEQQDDHKGDKKADHKADKKADHKADKKADHKADKNEHKGEKREDKAFQPPAPEPNAPEISPFAAALAAATGQEAKQHDTGPVPLPPPPGNSDLAISEPSGLLGLSHLSQAPSPLPRASEKPVIDTFGGVAVTPPGSNGTSSSPPVVVVAGPAQGVAPWVKASIVGLLALVLVLGGTVIYYATRRPVTPPQQQVKAAEPTGKHVDDTPIQVAADPAPPTTIRPQQPATPEPRKGSTPRHAQAQRPANEPKLSAEQKKLAALYGDNGDKSAPKESAPVDHNQRAAGGGTVSQDSIMAVAKLNRRGLTLCYERALKRDPTLKRARVVTQVKVGISGIVQQVTVQDPQYASSEIGQCLTQTIKHWHFPSTDEAYTTELPIILQAE